MFSSKVGGSFAGETDWTKLLAIVVFALYANLFVKLTAGAKISLVNYYCYFA